MGLDRQWGECHVAGLRLGRLRGDARGLDVVYDVVQELAENRKRRTGRIWVHLDVGVFCGGRVEVGLWVEGEDGFLEGF